MATPLATPMATGIRSCASPELRRAEAAPAADVEMPITLLNGISSKKTAGDSPVHVLRRYFFQAYGCIIVSTSFLVSVSLVNMTKWVYVKHAFKHPFFLTSTHMAASYIFAHTAIHWFHLSGAPEQRRILSLREQVFVVAPFSLLGAASIACGNTALVFLYPSFHEMLQNCTPFWTMVLAILLQKRRFSTAAYSAMLLVILGGCLCTLGEMSNFPIVGVFFSIMATVLRAFRTLLQDNLLRGREKLDSITLLYYAAPFNLALFLCGSFIFEGLRPWREFPALGFGGKFSIAMAAFTASQYNLLAYLIVGHLGAVGSMVINNLKTPTVIVMCGIIFGNPFTWPQALGFALASVGAYLYTNQGEKRKGGEQTAIKPGTETKAETTQIGKTEHELKYLVTPPCASVSL